MTLRTLDGALKCSFLDFLREECFAVDGHCDQPFDFGSGYSISQEIWISYLD